MSRYSIINTAADAEGDMLKFRPVAMEAEKIGAED